jgi:phosphopentomutase
MQHWYEACGLSGSLCNGHASGTDAIARYGDEHVRNGLPICYTSADSVFQVAAHEEHFGLDRLLASCEAAKRIFDELAIARVIARPFVGSSGNYRRSANRRDYTTPPPEPTLLDVLVAAGREVHAVGKIDDIFASRGVTQRWKGEDTAALCEQTLCALAACADGGIVFTNLVDFDSHYGHRRDTAGYAQALERFDAALPRLLGALRPGDLLALTADHGCDPTWPGSDHTRECVPLLFGGPAAPAGLGIGPCTSLADLGQTLARHLEISALRYGTACWT